MNDRTQNTGDQNDRPLFTQADEQERIYAPQQVPGAIDDDLEKNRDRDATEPVVPGTLSTGIDTPIPGAKAIDVDRDRGAERSK